MEELIKYYTWKDHVPTPEHAAKITGIDDYYDNYLGYNHETNRIEKTGYRRLHLIPEEYLKYYWEGNNIARSRSR